MLLKMLLRSYDRNRRITSGSVITEKCTYHQDQTTKIYLESANTRVCINVDVVGIRLLNFDSVLGERMQITITKQYPADVFLNHYQHLIFSYILDSLLIMMTLYPLLYSPISPPVSELRHLQHYK